jgi:hypothetical protein
MNSIYQFCYQNPTAGGQGSRFRRSDGFRAEQPRVADLYGLAGGCIMLPRAEKEPLIPSGRCRTLTERGQSTGVVEAMNDLQPLMMRMIHRTVTAVWQLRCMKLAHGEGDCWMLKPDKAVTLDGQV